jgi:hypothetical protein
VCDVDELEFAEYLRYVEARLASPIPGDARILAEVPSPLKPVVLPTLAEA